jgi:hypothetical protein
MQAKALDRYENCRPYRATPSNRRHRGMPSVSIRIQTLGTHRLPGSVRDCVVFRRQLGFLASEGQLQRRHSLADAPCMVTASVTCAGCSTAHRELTSIQYVILRWPSWDVDFRSRVRARACMRCNACRCCSRTEPFPGLPLLPRPSRHCRTTD